MWLCDATVCSCNVNSSAPHPGCPETGRIVVLCKKHALRWGKTISYSPGLSCGGSLSNVTCEREAGSGQRERDWKSEARGRWIGTGKRTGIEGGRWAGIETGNVKWSCLPLDRPFEHACASHRDRAQHLLPVYSNRQNRHWWQLPCNLPAHQTIEALRKATCKLFRSILHKPGPFLLHPKRSYSALLLIFIQPPAVSSAPDLGVHELNSVCTVWL